MSMTKRHIEDIKELVKALESDAEEFKLKKLLKLRKLSEKYLECETEKEKKKTKKTFKKKSLSE